MRSGAPHDFIAWEIKAFPEGKGLEATRFCASTVFDRDVLKASKRQKNGVSKSPIFLGISPRKRTIRPIFGQNVRFWTESPKIQRENLVILDSRTPTMDPSFF